MKKLIASVILFIAVTFCSAQEISIASYNMMRLGYGTKDYATLASVVDDFDLVGAIEVMRPAGMESVLQKLPESWSYVISDRAVGTLSYREYYGFFYNDRIEVIRILGFYPNTGFIRPPFGVQFRVKETGFVFNLVIAHIIYGDNVSQRIAEIIHLGNVYTYFEMLTGDQSKTIIAGDFNEETLSDFSPLTSLGLSEMTSVGKTTLGQRAPANDYDHIFVSALLVSRIVKSDVWYWTTDWSTRKTVSDHFPVYCILEVGQ
jgi:hypothetical protein